MLPRFSATHDLRHHGVHLAPAAAIRVHKYPLLPETFMYSRFVLFLLFCFSVSFLACGGNSTSKSSAPPTSSTAPAPSSSQPPTPTPTPIPAAADNYMATFTDAVGRNNFPQVFGTLSIDSSANNGNGSAQIKNAGATGNYTLLFCLEGPSCFPITNFTTDSSGNGSFTFTFPQKGTFSGIFQVNSGVAPEFEGGINTTVAGTSFTSALLPANANAPGSGRIGVAAQTATVSLTGGLASHSFDVVICGSQPTGACAPLGSLTTDANGNGSANIPVTNSIEIGIVVLRDAGGGARQYESAFRVQ